MFSFIQHQRTIIPRIRRVKWSKELKHCGKKINIFDKRLQLLWPQCYEKVSFCELLEQIAQNKHFLPLWIGYAMLMKKNWILLSNNSELGLNNWGIVLSTSLKVTEAGKLSKSEVETIEVEGCEYLFLHYMDGTRGYGFMSHKGNCKNPIHCHNKASN